MKSSKAVAMLLVSVISVIMFAGIAFAAECWNYDDAESCDEVAGCSYNQQGGNGWCERAGCQNFNNNETACDATSGCSWNSQASFCEMANCNNLNTANTCDAEAANGCYWNSGGWCYESGCWDYNDDETECNAADGCRYDDDQDFCVEEGSWDMQTEEDCVNASYTWVSTGSYCYEQGCWNYNNEDDCTGDCEWNDDNSYCFEPMCWDYDTQAECTADPTCSYDSYSKSCFQNGCWNYANQTACGSDNIGYDNCFWDTNGNFCRETGPWDYNDNQTECEAQNYSYNSGGWCKELGCWDYNTGNACNAAEGCQWNTQWSFCEQEPMNCWNYSSENGCEAVSSGDRSCNWQAGQGWCNKAGCWDYNFNQEGCVNATGCQWDSQGQMCNEAQCWMYDQGEELCGNHTSQGCFWNIQNWGWCEQIDCFKLMNQTACLASNDTIEMDCGWNSGQNFCYQEFSGGGPGGPGGGGGFGSCDDFDGNQTACFDTMFCNWVPDEESCEQPQMQPMRNPDCWGLPAQEPCGKVQGCTWSNNACNGIPTSEGIQCANITNAEFCGKIPFLSTCCKWNVTSCVEAPFTTQCWDSMQPAPAGANFCEDYNAIGSETICEQIAGDPWYMPCQWSNSTGKCSFKFNNMFGGGGGGFKDIGTKANCESAGGVWKTEQYTDPSGMMKTENWCEMGFGMNYETCDSACWACENQDDGSGWNSTADAQTACEDSGLGYCQWQTDTHAFNGFGWCNMKQDFMYGAGNCNDKCMDCFNEDKCEGSDASCKWFTDPANPSWGWCDTKNAKSCETDCFACNGQSSCIDSGLGGGGDCEWDSANYYCKPKNFASEVCFDGMDNDNNGMVDCSDPYCFGDSFCGGNKMSNCGMYEAAGECAGAAEGCVWVTDPIGGNSWCDMLGANCWLYKSSSVNCAAEEGCRWKTSDTGGMCDISQAKADACKVINKRAPCDANTNCLWKADKNNPNGGFCDFKAFGCNERNKATCATGSFANLCAWQNDQFSTEGGWCNPICFSEAYFNNNETCLSQSMCSWVDGMCEPDMVKQEDCYLFDGDQAGCNTANKTCAWHAKMGEAECNVEKSSNCPQYGAEGACTGNENCTWISDDWGHSWCENKFFGCFQYDNDQAACEDASATCAWMNDEQFGEGFICDPVCFTLDSEECENTDGCVLSSGFCDPKMSNQMFQGMEGGAPLWLGSDDCGEGLTPQSADICNMGMKEMPEAYGFGAGTVTMQSAAVCNGYMTWNGQGNGYDTTKYYLFIDVDNDEDTGCDAKDIDGSDIPGFEFKFQYIGEWLDGGLVETKVAYRCYNNTGWMPTKIPLSVWREKMCNELNGQMLAVDKGAWKKDPLFDFGHGWRIFAKTANSSTDWQTPVDSIGPIYYTPGSMDFKKEDCSKVGVDSDGDGFNAEDDPDCKDFQRFGYQPMEMCDDSMDNDKNGFTDCLDPSCIYNPICGGAFDWEADATDKTAPSVNFFAVDTFYDGAFIKFDTNEPANGSVMFYKSSATCSQLNKTLVDLGSPDWTFDDYKPFHGIMLDNYVGNPNKLGYNLANGTAYYFKYKVCDPSSNCAVSGCMNFTTQAVMQEYMFRMDVPGSGSVFFGDEELDGATMLNETEGKRKNITINCVSAGYSLTFLDANVKAAKTLNLSDFVCNSDEDLIGMGSATWNAVLFALDPDKVLISWAIGGDSATIEHCDSNGENCDDVTDLLECTLTATTLTCEIPVNLGFSTYKATVTSDDGGNGGGGGGASSNTASKASYYDASTSKSWAQQAAGQTMDMTINTGLIPVTKMSLETTKGITSLKLLVATLKKTPTDMKNMTNKAYKYMEIIKEGITDTDITNITVEFRVEKTWLLANSVNEANIALFRYSTSSKAWSMLSTIKTSTDGNYIYYKAATPGFSYFAIADKNAPIATTTTQSAATTTATALLTSTTLVAAVAGCGNGICDSGETAENCAADCSAVTTTVSGEFVTTTLEIEQGPPRNFTWLWVLVAAVAVLLLLYFILKKKHDSTGLPRI